MDLFGPQWPTGIQIIEGTTQLPGTGITLALWMGVTHGQDPLSPSQDGELGPQDMLGIHEKALGLWIEVVDGIEPVREAVFASQKPAALTGILMPEVPDHGIQSLMSHTKRTFGFGHEG